MITINKKQLLSPKAIFVNILIIGIFILCYSLAKPIYKNIYKYQEFNENVAQGKHTKETYYIARAEVTTNKIRLMDIGNGIVTSSGFILLFLYFFHINQWNDFFKLRTKNKLHIVLFCNIAWLLMIPGTFFYYWYRSYRGDYPPFADSVCIPIYYNTIGYLLFLIPLNLFLITSLIKTNFPTKVFFTIEKYNWRCIIWEIIFGIGFLLLLLCLILFIIDGNHISIVVFICLFYVLLVLRAGKHNYYNNRYLNNNKTEKNKSI